MQMKAYSSHSSTNVWCAKLLQQANRLKKVCLQGSTYFSDSVGREVGAAPNFLQSRTPLRLGRPSRL